MIARIYSAITGVIKKLFRRSQNTVSGISKWECRLTRKLPPGEEEEMKFLNVIIALSLLVCSQKATAAEETLADRAARIGDEEAAKHKQEVVKPPEIDCDKAHALVHEKCPKEEKAVEKPPHHPKKHSSAKATAEAKVTIQGSEVSAKATAKAETSNSGATPASQTQTVTSTSTTYGPSTPSRSFGDIVKFGVGARVGIDGVYGGFARGEVFPWRYYDVGLGLELGAVYVDNDHLSSNKLDGIVRMTAEGDILFGSLHLADDIKLRGGLYGEWIGRLSPTKKTALEPGVKLVLDWGVLQLAANLGYNTASEEVVNGVRRVPVIDNGFDATFSAALRF